MSVLITETKINVHFKLTKHDYVNYPIEALFISHMADFRSSLTLKDSV